MDDIKGWQIFAKEFVSAKFAQNMRKRKSDARWND
jgi:hypothetical protein